MNLSEKSWHARIFKAFYPNTKLPDSLCNYFWATIVAILLIIPAHPAIIFNLFVKNAKMPGGVGLLITFLCLLIGGASLTAADIDVNIAIIYLVGLGVLTIMILLLIGLFYLSSYVTDKFSEYRKSKKSKRDNENRNIIIEYVKGVKGKYCPHINWK